MSCPDGADRSYTGLSDVAGIGMRRRKTTLIHFVLLVDVQSPGYGRHVCPSANKLAEFNMSVRLLYYYFATYRFTF